MTDAEREFVARLNQLHRDAKRAGLTLEELVAVAGVASNTVRRWRQRPPKTIQTLGLMEKLVADRLSGRA